MIGDPDHLFIDRNYLRDIGDYVRRGKLKIRDDRYKYSTKNIQIPLNFEIEELFKKDNSNMTKLPSEFYHTKRNQIEKFKSSSLRRRSAQQQNFYYNKHNEFMQLDDFLEFYHKFLEKRKEENEKLHYKRKFANEVVKIRKIKTKKFMETETLKLGGKLTKADENRLKIKLKKFIGGLDYALDKLNYQQAEKMLRKLTTTPQPPLNSNLGYRTRLYTIKTGGNLDRALTRILQEREESGAIKKITDEELKEEYAEKMKRYGTKYGQMLKRSMQAKIQASMDKLDHLLTNKPVRRRKKPGVSKVKMYRTRTAKGLMRGSRYGRGGSGRKMRRVTSQAPRKARLSVSRSRGERSEGRFEGLQEFEDGTEHSSIVMN